MGLFSGSAAAAENAHRRGFFDAVGRTEIEAAALQFRVVAALALFDEQRPGVFLEKFQLGGSLRQSRIATNKDQGRKGEQVSQCISHGHRFPGSGSVRQRI